MIPGISDWERESRRVSPYFALCRVGRSCMYVDQGDALDALPLIGSQLPAEAFPHYELSSDLPITKFFPKKKKKRTADDPIPFRYHKHPCGIQVPRSPQPWVRALSGFPKACRKRALFSLFRCLRLILRTLR